MNLYKTSGQSGADSFKNKWAGSLADASKDRVAMKKEGLKDVGTETVEIPTNKAGLLEWLNTNVS